MAEINDTFIGIRDFESGQDEFEFINDNDLLASDPVEIIVARVVFALLVSVSLVMNLLLALAVGRRWSTVHLIYILAASMALPDLVFYAKLVAELVNSYGQNVPSWATSGMTKRYKVNNKTNHAFQTGLAGFGNFPLISRPFSTPASFWPLSTTRSSRCSWTTPADTRTRRKNSTP